MINSVDFNFSVEENVFVNYLESIGRVIKPEHSGKVFSDIFKEIVKDETFAATIEDYVHDLFVNKISIHGSESMDRNCWD